MRKIVLIVVLGLIASSAMAGAPVSKTCAPAEDAGRQASSSENLVRVQPSECEGDCSGTVYLTYLSLGPSSYCTTALLERGCAGARATASEDCTGSDCYCREGSCTTDETIFVLSESPPIYKYICEYSYEGSCAGTGD